MVFLNFYRQIPQWQIKLVHGRTFLILPIRCSLTILLHGAAQPEGLINVIK